MSVKNYSIKNRPRENIEAEEIFLDAEAVRSIEEKGKLEQPIREKNFITQSLLCLVSIKQ